MMESATNSSESNRINDEVLAPAERDRIVIEERYRADIREQLTQHKPAKSRVWGFLNSTFGIWLLSAILLSWGGTLYTQSQNRQAERLKQLEAERLDATRKKELVERLDLEIAYRLSQIQIQLAGMSNWMTGKAPFRLLQGKSEADVKVIIDGLGERPKRGLYDEFSQFSTVALIAELRRYVPLEERSALDNVIAHLSGIYVRLEVDGIKLSDVDGVARSMYKNATLDRWRAGAFYFSDCPFC